MSYWTTRSLQRKQAAGSIFCKILTSLTGLSLYVTFELKRTITVSEVEMTAPTTYCNECGASNPLQAKQCFACSTALQPTAPSPLIANQAAPINTAIPASNVIGPLVPSYLLHSRYSITRQIRTGGFGAVYQAKDTCSNQGNEPGRSERTRVGRGYGCL